MDAGFHLEQIIDQETLLLAYLITFFKVLLYLFMRVPLFIPRKLPESVYCSSRKANSHVQELGIFLKKRVTLTIILLLEKGKKENKRMILLQDVNPVLGNVC